nr:hypothetical protein [Candidatus Sigynarchaeota archaeon]
MVITFNILAILSLVLLAFIPRQGTCQGVILDDPQNDVVGGVENSYDSQNEIAYITCGNPPSAPSIDIKRLTWEDHEPDWVIRIEFWDAIDEGNLSSGAVFIEVQISTNGSAIEQYQIAAFTDSSGANWNGSMFVEDGSMFNCARNVSATEIEWTFPKSLVSQNVVGELTFDNWISRCYAIYYDNITGVFHYAWDVMNFTTFTTYWGLVCGTPNTGINGFEMTALGFASVVAIIWVSKRITRKP